MGVTKAYLIDVAKKLDLKGIYKLNKAELIDFITSNSCITVTREQCEKLSRPELRKLARTCNIKISNRKSGPICEELTSKYKDIDRIELTKLIAEKEKMQKQKTTTTTTTSRKSQTKPKSPVVASRTSKPKSPVVASRTSKPKSPVVIS